MPILRDKVKLPFILLLKFYRYFISPILGKHCRFEPSCSQYMYEAIEKFGVFGGIKLGIKRLLKCHPWKEGGYDPIP